MLAVKKSKISKNKLAVYASLLIVIIAGFVVQIFLSYFPSEYGEGDQGIVTYGAGGDSAGKGQDVLSGVATSTPAQLDIYEIGLYSAIVDNPKYKALREGYLDDMRPIQKGKDNPFSP